MIDEKNNEFSKEKSAKNIGNDGPWGEEYQKSVPPFDLEKAKERVAKTNILSSTEDIPNYELRQKVLERQEKMRRDEEIARLADEAETRLGRNLSQAELQDLAEQYDIRLKKSNKESEQSSKDEGYKVENSVPEFDPTLYANESEWRAANSASSEQRRQSISDTLIEQSPTVKEIAQPTTEKPKLKEILEEAPENDNLRNNAETENRLELLSENEMRNVLGLLNGSELNVDQIFMISHGSRSSEESAIILKRMFQNMTERSVAMLTELQNGRNLGELEAFESVYENDMGKSFGYSMQALKNLREKARMLPASMAGGFVFQLQQVENNLLAVNDLVTRRHNLNTRDKNPTVPKEKMVADEREAEEYVDRSKFGY